MDKIEIRNLEIFANHGVFPEFVVSATLYTDTRKAGLSDELTASIHYGEVSHMITKFAKEHTYKLLEALAENLCQMLLHELPLLKKITLRVEKPWAPVGLPLEAGIPLTLHLAPIWVTKRNFWITGSRDLEIPLTVK